MMNWQHVQDAVVAKLQSLQKLDAEIRLPNDDNNDRPAQFVELTVSPIGSFPGTDHAMRHLGSIDHVVNVQSATGTNVAYALAAMISDMYSPIESSKAGFRAGPYWAYVREVRQLPPNRTDTLFRINVRVGIEIFVTKGE